MGERGRPRGYGLVLVLCLTVASVGLRAWQSLEFSRPTLTAVTLPAAPRFGHVLFEDDRYRFVARDNGSGLRTEPGLFVYSKRADAWIRIVSLSTEHARFGRSPDDIVTPIGWDFGELIGQAFASVPLRSGFIVFPDRIVDAAPATAYRLDFQSGLNRDETLTSFWVSKADLEAAFEGRYTPALVDPRDTRDVPLDVHPSDGLVVPVRVDGGEWLRWRIDTKTPGVLVEARRTGTGAAGSTRARVRLDVGGAVAWDEIASMGHASRTNNIGGVLGTGLFDRFSVAVDYDAKRVRLAEYGGGREDGVPVAVEWPDGGPRLTAALALPGGGTREVRLCVDVAEPRPVVLRDGAEMAVLPSLRLASFRLVDVPVFVDANVPGGCGGVLGNGVLRRFRVTFERRRQRLLLAPGGLFDVPFDHDAAGFALVVNGRAVGVAAVEPGTPAAAAGLRGGDVLVEMDGRPVAGRSLTDVRRAFRVDGRARVLVVRRQGGRRELTLLMPGPR